MCVCVWVLLKLCSFVVVFVVAWMVAVVWLVFKTVQFASKQAQWLNCLPGLQESRFKSRSGSTIDFIFGAPVTARPDAILYGVSAGTGCPGVSILQSLQ